MPGTLYIVATPIGNLKDLTFRAKEILESVGAIACEDTRVTVKLLNAYGIKKPLFAVHQHATANRISLIVERLNKGEDIAYVSDAGTPGVNDPGGKLVEEAMGYGVKVEPIPGASALTAVISVCGFPMERYTYLGFAPHKKGRQTFFRELAENTVAAVFFESTHRLLKTLEALKDNLHPKRMVCVGRELTKMHETVYRGTSEQVLEQVKSTSDKGEAVLVIAPSSYA